MNQIEDSVLNDAKQIFASKYKLTLPTEEDLQTELNKARKRLELENGNKGCHFHSNPLLIPNQTADLVRGRYGEGGEMVLSPFFINKKITEPFLNSVIFIYTKLWMVPL